ncbi:hypothetical protein [Pseudolabrys taiwanensis]|uniref:hypothetical protein n=1 Tax=Pseudolabrys taiwanensis TaxID=331696 RepID=UPI0013B3593A|nr:hypothetical protein [Pseudolabrys taiwanensis]
MGRLDRAFEEIAHGKPELLGHRMEAPGPDTVLAYLLFLGLLKGEADGLTQIRLGELLGHTGYLQPLTDRHVHGAQWTA